MKEGGNVRCALLALWCLLAAGVASPPAIGEESPAEPSPAGKYAEPRWKPGPDLASPEKTARLRELLQEYPAARADSFSRSQEVIVSIASLGTEGAARALMRFYRGEKEYVIRTYLIEAIPSADGKEAAKGLLDVLAVEKDRRLRPLLRKNLRMLGTKAAARVMLKKGLSHKDPGIRADVARALGTLRWKEALPPLLRATRDRKEDPKLAAIEALGALAINEVIDPLLDLASKKDDATAVTALWALGETRSEDPRIRDLALKLLRESKQDAMKVQAVCLLGNMGEAGAVADILPLLGHKGWALRVASAKALGDFRVKEGVGPLIEQLGKEEGRLAHDVSRALFRITGIDIGTKAELWRDWWEKNKGTFEVPPILGRGKVQHKALTEATYHRIPLVSKRVIFLLDVSASMGSKMESAEETREGSRLDYCRRELIGTIRHLGKDVRFNVLVFGSSVVPRGKSVVPATLSHKQKADSFIQGLRPGGGTNLADALEVAFRDKNVDTLYLLSDGEPTVGRIIGVKELLRWVRRMNGPRNLVIHTISSGELASSDFLKRMAEQNGGRHVALK